MSVLIKLVVVAVLLGVVIAVEKPCCLSKKWTGKMKITSTYLHNGSLVPVTRDNTLMIDFDKDMRMDRVIGDVYTFIGSSETTSNYTVYNDYRHMKKYVIVGTGSCKVSAHLDDQIDPCVPHTLQHMGTYRMGSVNASVSVNGWNGIYHNFYYTMATTVDDCTPVTMSRFGTDEHGTRITESTLYADITQYTTSPDAFHLPDDCKHGSMEVGK